MNKIIDDKLSSLSQSKFRHSFHLRKYMINYINRVGMDVIKEHTIAFINSKLAPAYPINDGKQTPMKNHPVFIAMHATGCCCRGCLFKWHHIPKGRALTNNEKNYIYLLIMEWLKREYNKKD